MREVRLKEYKVFEVTVKEKGSRGPSALVGEKFTMIAKNTGTLCDYMEQVYDIVSVELMMEDNPIRVLLESPELEALRGHSER